MYTATPFRRGVAHNKLLKITGCRQSIDCTIFGQLGLAQLVQNLRDECLNLEGR
ncbi:hypothetical protein PanWU01x14_224880, partial [Parasponia andersonii]